MKCKSCGCEFQEGKRCPNCGTESTDLTDLYGYIESKYGKRIKQANFLKEILNICIKYREEGLGIVAILSSLNSFTRIREAFSTDSSIFSGKTIENK